MVIAFTSACQWSYGRAIISLQCNLLSSASYAYLNLYIGYSTGEFQPGFSYCGLYGALRPRKTMTDSTTLLGYISHTAKAIALALAPYSPYV